MGKAHSRELQTLLKEETVQTIIDSQPRTRSINVSLEDTIQHSLMKMKDHGVHSLPVFDEKLNSYIGIIDHQDILRLLYRIYIEKISEGVTTIREIISKLMHLKVIDISGGVAQKRD
jgi:CBS domain-containing protein